MREPPMSLKAEREPVEVLANPCSAQYGEAPHWLPVTRYIMHTNDTLTWVGFPNGPRRHSKPTDWRKVSRES